MGGRFSRARVARRAARVHARDQSRGVGTGQVDGGGAEPSPAGREEVAFATFGEEDTIAETTRRIVVGPPASADGAVAVATDEDVVQPDIVRTSYVVPVMGAFSSVPFLLATPQP